MSYKEVSCDRIILENKGKETESMGHKPKYGIQVPHFHAILAIFTGGGTISLPSSPLVEVLGRSLRGGGGGLAGGGGIPASK